MSKDRKYPKRTPIRDIIRLAWALYKHPYRDTWRISQIISNTADAEPVNILFYMENKDLIKKIKNVH
jgi:hypothetical protein